MSTAADVMPGNVETVGPEPALRRVVVGIDFRDSCAAAVRWTARHLAPEAELVLVHAEVHPARRLSPEQSRWLKALRRSLGSGRRVRLRIGRGAAAPEIARAAAEHGADLVVVGAHGAPPGRPGTLGSTAERLVRCSPVPVVLAAGALDGAPRVVLVPVDADDVTAPVLDWVHWLADRFDASVAAVHVERPTPRRVRAVRAVGAEVAPEGARWRRLATGERAHPFLADAVSGTLDRAVLHESERFRAGLVVLGGRTRHAGGEPAGRAVGRVLREATCPVMVVADR